MKYIVSSLIAILMINYSCSNSNKNLFKIYNTYFGTYQSNDKNNLQKPSLDISVEIKQDSIELNYDSVRLKLGYKIDSHNDDFITFTASTIDANKSLNYNFKFDLKSNVLTLSSNVFSSEIKLLTYNDIMQSKVDEFASVKLHADISRLSPKEKQMLPILFDVANIMDELFWQQIYPNKEELYKTISNENSKKFFNINYGPWEQLNNNKSFIDGIGTRPDGAFFYPLDMSKEEFENFNSPDKKSWYTNIIRDQKGKLQTIPYSELYKDKLKKASELLFKASELAENETLKKYLKLRASAFLSNNYYDSDIAWMDLKNSNIDFIAGPIESYNDGLFGFKTSFESFILIKDIEWSKKLDRFAVLLPEIQKSLPVEAKYKTEVPGKDSELGVYEAICYAGDCNAGSKTIAINLPNDKKVNAMKGSRKLQLKNSMQAKFDKILLPMSSILISKEQQKNIKFDAFFENTMFHEVAHGLGISNTINNKGLVSDNLKDINTSLEECKADILGLYIVTWLYENKHLNEHELIDNYVTLMAGIFRSVRFGAATSHGIANMIEFNYFEREKAFTRNEDGTYTVNFEKMKDAVKSLSNLIIKIQGDGDYSAGKKLLSEMGIMKVQLTQDLNKISDAKIPRDIIFEQGKQLYNFN